MPTLTRNATEKIKLPNGKTVHLPKCCTSFKRSRRKGIPTYGGKTILTLDGKPLFAELVVLRLLEKEGWHGVWVDSYQGIKYLNDMPHVKEPIDPPTREEKLLKKIRDKAACRGGCFDVFAWHCKKTASWN